MNEIELFARALKRHWVALLTSSLPIAVLWIAQGRGWFTPPSWFYVIAGGLALVVAAFRAWRDEHRKAEATEGELLKVRAADEEAPIPNVPNEHYWLLSIVRGLFLRREFHVAADGVSSNSIWIGETPIYHRDCIWFYDLVGDAVSRGFLRLEPLPGGNAVYRLPPESVKVLEVERRRKRPVIPPNGNFVDARTGERTNIPTPG